MLINVCCPGEGGREAGSRQRSAKPPQAADALSRSLFSNKELVVIFIPIVVIVIVIFSAIFVIAIVIDISFVIIIFTALDISIITISDSLSRTFTRTKISPFLSLSLSL